MKKRENNPTGEMARWLRLNADKPEVATALKQYRKTFRFTEEEYKQVARLRERLEMQENGFTAPVPEGLYYKRATDIVYKVTKGIKTAEWRNSSRTWWSKDADMVALYKDIKNGITVKLTPTLASEIGLHTGICCVCGKTLTTKKSMELGIGPECNRRLKEEEENFKGEYEEVFG